MLDKTFFGFSGDGYQHSVEVEYQPGDRVMITSVSKSDGLRRSVSAEFYVNGNNPSHVESLRMLAECLSAIVALESTK